MAATIPLKVSTRTAADEELRKCEAELAELQSLAQLGTWSWDIKTDTVTWSDELYRIFGLQPQQFPATYEAFLACIHPEDRGHTQDHVEEALRTREPYVDRRRVVRPNGEIRVVEARGTVVCDENGEPIRLFGTSQDVTERERVEAALRQSEERYRELFENSRDAIYVHDLNGRYVSVNRAAEALSGYNREEVLGKHYSNFVLPTQLKTVRENFCRKLDVPIETTYETQMVCKDGTRKSVEVSSRMIYRDGEPVGVQGTVRDITERKRAQRALQTYSRRLVHAQEAERESIARELHDEIGQALTAISMNLEWIHRSGAVQESALPRIRESIGVIDDALRRVRELSFELRPSLLNDLGLAAALSWYAERFSARTGIAAKVIDNLPKSDRIQRAVETACFRIVQEALTDTARHSRATEAVVNLERTTNSFLKLTISDNGVGFLTGTELDGHASLALGLRGMEERALAVGGSVKISSEPDKGTQVLLMVPIGPFPPASHQGFS